MIGAFPALVKQISYTNHRVIRIARIRCCSRELCIADMERRYGISDISVKKRCYPTTARLGTNLDCWTKFADVYG